MDKVDCQDRCTTVREVLEREYPGRFLEPDCITDLPSEQYVVYILESGDGVIVAGHGQSNRARVIFDSETTVTGGHVKAIFVRLHQLFGRRPSGFRRYLVLCADKREAQEVEERVHKMKGGNSRELPTYIEEALFEGIIPHSVPWMLLKMAVASSYDGLTDLRGWNREGFIEPPDWEIIRDKLRLDKCWPK